MKAQLLEKPPVDGTYPEQWYDAVGDCTWVLFEDKDYQDWVGVFGQGRVVRFSTALLFDMTDSALVISCGRGFVVDVDSRELRYQVNSDSLVGAAAIPDRDLIIVVDCYVSLRALTSTGEVWRSDRVALDGIRLDEVSSENLTGQVWHLDGWHPFTLDLEDWSFVRG